MEHPRTPAQSSGYLYGLVCGFYPDPASSDPTSYQPSHMRLHIKLGSLRTDDPLGALRTAYSRSHGVPQVVCLEPTANAYRDEQHELFTEMLRYRVWAAHEIFAFDNLTHALAMLQDFSKVFHTRTAHEEDAKPPHLEPAPVSARLTLRELDERRAARERLQEADRRQREQEREQEQAEQEAARRAKRDRRRARQQAHAHEAQDAIAHSLAQLDAFMAEHCVLDSRGWISEAEFNARAPVVHGGMKQALQERALVRKQVRIDGGRKWGWKGLRWR